VNALGDEAEKSRGVVGEIKLPDMTRVGVKRPLESQPRMWQWGGEVYFALGTE
jgi:hypothetical protein